VPAKLDVHLVMDNYGTHKTPSVPQAFTEPLHRDIHTDLIAVSKANDDRSSKVSNLDFHALDAIAGDTLLLKPAYYASHCF
jgi:hypothetical protein